LYAGRAFYFLLAGLAKLRVIVHVPSVLVDEEQPKKLGRELLHGEVCVSGRKIVAQDGILIASCVVVGHEFQGALHDRRFTSLRVAVCMVSESSSQ
jgi:hypothetical protein